MRRPKLTTAPGHGSWANEDEARGIYAPRCPRAGQNGAAQRGDPRAAPRGNWRFGRNPTGAEDAPGALMKTFAALSLFTLAPAVVFTTAARAQQFGPPPQEQVTAAEPYQMPDPYQPPDPYDTAADP